MLIHNRYHTQCEMQAREKFSVTAVGRNFSVGKILEVCFLRIKNIAVEGIFLIGQIIQLYNQPFLSTNKKYEPRNKKFLRS